MCFDARALPPDPARTGMGAGTERTELVADDGSRLAATVATTRDTASAGVAIIPDVRGLHPYYERLAEHIADAGIHAVAIDPYGRTAGPEHRGEDFEYRSHRARVTADGVRADVRAAAKLLRDLGATPVASMGFCFGGLASLLQASQPGMDGVVAFYGPPADALDGGSSPLEEARAGLVRVPVLGLYGGADEGIPQRDTDDYAAALDAAGVAQRIVVYPDAPHSFFDRRMSQHAEACRDAWARVLGFIDSLER
jgi:carboxymethylenebutenolidase